MSKLDEIIDDRTEEIVNQALLAETRGHNNESYIDQPQFNLKEQIKDLIRELIDDTFGKEDGNAYRILQKIEEL